MNTGKSVEVRYDHSFLGVKYHKLIGIHVGDVEPPLRRVKTLIIEADCWSRQGDIRYFFEGSVIGALRANRRV